MSFWRLNGGSSIIVGAAGKPIDCGDCPCGEPVQTDCCVDPIPATLTATYTLRTGDCTCIADTVTLFNLEGFTSWESESGAICGGCLARLVCTSGNWEFGNVASCSALATLVSEQCDPLVLVFDVDNSAMFPGECTGTYRVTITE